MRLLVILSILLLTVPFTASSIEIPPDKDVIVFPGKKGDVTFLHKLHSGLVDVGGLEKVECSTCHHTYEGEGEVKVCDECHVRSKKKIVNKAPNLKKAYHYRCRSCHKYTMKEGKHAGPNKKCKLCHVKAKKEKKKKK